MEGCITFLMTAFPMLLICSLVAIISTVAQTRGLFTMESLAPKFSRLSPLQGLKRMFSLRGVIELLKAMIKIIILGSIIWNALQKDFWNFSRLMDMEPFQAMTYTGDMILSIVQPVAIAMAFVAGFDLFYQWWDYEKNRVCPGRNSKRSTNRLKAIPRSRVRSGNASRLRHGSV